jgi:hypothetical protein
MKILRFDFTRMTSPATIVSVASALLKRTQQIVGRTDIIKADQTCLYTCRLNMTKHGTYGSIQIHGMCTLTRSTAIVGVKMEISFSECHTVH